MRRIQLENTRRIGAFLPAILMALILLLPSFVHGQYTTYHILTVQPDLQVAEMKYWASNCTMYFRIANNGGASTKFSVWVDYYPLRKEVMSAPAMAANSSTWVEKSMWKKTSTGQTYCSMNGVSSVRSVANARYLYKYAYNQWTIGPLLSTGTYSGWYVAERQVSETSTINNELMLPKSSLPTTTTKMTAIAVY